MSVLGDKWTDGCGCSLLRSQTGDPCRWDGVSWHGVPAKRSWADLKESWVLISEVTQYSNKQTSPIKEPWRKNFSGWCCHRACKSGLCWLMNGQDRYGKENLRQENPAFLRSLIHDTWCFLYMCCLQSDEFKTKNICTVLNFKHQKTYSFILVHLLGSHDHHRYE